ncbi:MAG: alpha/beta fold hydrolase [Bacteroidota bacterium]
MRILRNSLLVIFLIYVTLTYFISSMIVKPPPRRTTDRSAEILMERWQIDLDSFEALLPVQEEVEIESHDGLMLKGFWLSSTQERPNVLDTVAGSEAEAEPNCLVLLAHGYTDNHSGTFKYAPLFDSCGCDLLMINHRGHGKSEGELLTGGVLEGLDLRRWHAYARERSGLAASKIGWVGESWGAASMLQGASGMEDPPAFLLAESPYSNWDNAISERAIRDFGPVVHLLLPGVYTWCRIRTGEWVGDADAQTRVKDLEVPTLLIHSKADPDTHYEQSQQIYDAIPEATPSELHLLDWGSHHVHSIYDRPDEYRALFWNFVDEEAPDFCE